MILDVRVGKGNGVTECDDFDGIFGVIYSGGTDSVAICSGLTFKNCGGNNLFAGDFKLVFENTDVEFDFLEMTIAN